MDTGAAHYASKEGAGKTLIIQSGFSNFEHWGATYDFEAIQIPIDCRPCWNWKLIKKHPDEACNNLRGTCKKNHKCMKDISPEMVLESVIKKL